MAYPIPKKPYIVLENLYFDWDEGALPIFCRLWNEGKSIQYIAEAFDRRTVEVALLVIDQAEQGKIKPRRGGLWGVC